MFDLPPFGGCRRLSQAAALKPPATQKLSVYHSQPTLAEGLDRRGSTEPPTIIAVLEKLDKPKFYKYPHEQIMQISTKSSRKNLPKKKSKADLQYEEDLRKLEVDMKQIKERNMKINPEIIRQAVFDDNAYLEK